MEQTRLGEQVPRPAVEEACQLLGHDPASVLLLTLTPNTMTVVTVERTIGRVRELVTYHHVVR